VTPFAVLATGLSMSRAVADSVSHLPRIVINDAFRLAPDALALCANDAAWWGENAEAKAFNGRRFSMASVTGVDRVPAEAGIGRESNSALLGLHVAVKAYGAKQVFLYGVDLQGEHYFGQHQRLNNPTPHRFDVFKQQFAVYANTLHKDVEVFNASPNSALKCFPFRTL